MEFEEVRVIVISLLLISLESCISIRNTHGASPILEKPTRLEQLEDQPEQELQRPF